MRRRSKTNTKFFEDIVENQEEKKERPNSVYRFIKKKE